MKMLMLRTFMMAVLMLPVLIPGQDLQDSQQEKIIEKVEVTNVAVAVRVFHKGKPVKGLKKEDFKLFKNGGEKEVRVFLENRKKMTKNDTGYAASVTRKPRLFLLIFNVSDPSIDMIKAVEPFYKNILRVGDRLIVLSNSFFLNERIVYDPQKERQKIEHILQIESLKAKQRYSQMKVVFSEQLKEMWALIAIFDGRLAISAREIFIRKYLETLKAYKEQFMKFNGEQFVRLANSLEDRDIEKWVLNFFQQNHYLIIKQGSQFDGFLRPSMKYLELVRELNIPAEKEAVDFSQLFLNTGASFHTILLGTENRKYKTMGGLAYAPLAADTMESILKKVTRLTGGNLTRSNNTDKFFKKLTDYEDVYYTLIYAPGQVDVVKEGELKVVVNNKKYKVVYDNQKRKKSFRKLLEKMEKEIPQIILGDLSVEDGILRVPVSNIKMQVNGDSDSDDEVGKIRMRVGIFKEKEAKFIFERKKEIVAKKEKLEVRIFLHQLNTGNYRIFVEVTDLSTNKNDMGYIKVH